MKLAEAEESRLEAAREPRLDVRDPGLLPEDRLCMLPERLGMGERRTLSGWASWKLPGKHSGHTVSLDPPMVPRADRAPPLH